jgi:hypothetical protein
VLEPRACCFLSSRSCSIRLRVLHACVCSSALSFKLAPKQPRFAITSTRLPSTQQSAAMADNGKEVEVDLDITVKTVVIMMAMEQEARPLLTHLNLQHDPARFSEAAPCQCYSGVHRYRLTVHCMLLRSLANDRRYNCCAMLTPHLSFC